METYLSLKRGDLIKLDDGILGETISAADARWARGICNDRNGEFPIEAVYVLPTIVEPPNKILHLFRDSSVKARKHKAPNYNTLQRLKMHTLRKYAVDNFRSSIE